MEKYIPKDKLSKKARKKLNKKSRSVWMISPVTRRSEDPKVYRRNREKANIKKEICSYM